MRRSSSITHSQRELYATRLLKARVQVRHRRFAGQMHGFFTMVGLLPGAGEALDYVTAAIDEHLTREAANTASAAVRPLAETDIEAGSKRPSSPRDRRVHYKP